MLIVTIIVVVQVVLAVWLLADLLRLATGFYNLFEKKLIFSLRQVCTTFLGWKNSLSHCIVRVLLVEAGGEMPWIGSVPGLVALLQKSPVDWAFKTEVEASSSVECSHFGHSLTWPIVWKDILRTKNEVQPPQHPPPRTPFVQAMLHLS